MAVTATTGDPPAPEGPERSEGRLEGSFFAREEAAQRRGKKLKSAVAEMIGAVGPSPVVDNRHCTKHNGAASIPSDQDTPHEFGGLKIGDVSCTCSTTEHS